MANPPENLFAQEWNERGRTFRREGRLEQAIAAFRQALALKPDFGEAHNNLGNALQALGKPEEAADCYRQALEVLPNSPETLLNFANLLIALNQPAEAYAAFCRALELRPHFPEAHFGLGNLFMGQNYRKEGHASYRKALELNPDYLRPLSALVQDLQHECSWDDLEVLSQRLVDTIDALPEGSEAPLLPPFAFLSLPTPTTAAQQLRFARKYVARYVNMPAPPRRFPTPDRKARIKVGYLSADFHGHATAWLIAELFEKHDREQFEIIGYSIGPDDGSAMRRRLIEGFDRFVDLRERNYLESAERIADDRVDILVDLKGYTYEARPEILALRPAPIQVNYLGFPGTMGAPFMDYILVDDFAVPADQQPFFSERLVHLPGSYQINDSKREVSPRTPTRAECGLREEGPVFCCFNLLYKITPAVFRVWMRVLKQTPGSVLWLLEGNRSPIPNLCKEAEAQGVSGDRLVFAPFQKLPEHLARYRLADLFLDTFPYNGHTTASDSLWVGCPVLTLSGQTFASRVAGGLLRTIGLPELIAADFAEYEALALRLAHEPGLLAEMRGRLQANRTSSRLFDATQFARSLEEAYRAMWRIYCAGAKPQPIDLSRFAS